MRGYQDLSGARLGRLAVTLLALALGLATLGGCLAARPAPPSTPANTSAAGGLVAFPLTITDDAGRTVRFDGPPARVVSLAPANTEIVYALGLFSRVVGVTTFDDYPVQVKDVAKVGDFQTPNIEAIANQSPDVVLVTGGVQADVIASLEKAGAKVVVVDPKDLDGVFKAIDLLGRILGVPEKSASVVAKMRSGLGGIVRRVAAEKPVTAFMEIGWSPLYTAGRGTLLDDLLIKAGGTNVVTQSGYVGYSVEQLVKDQPTAYLGTRSSIGTAAAIAKRPGYAALAAVKTRRVYSLDDNLVSRPGPRVIEGVLQIAKALHPNAFK